MLLIDSDSGRSEVYLRYSGSDHNGFDDGSVVRDLTGAAVRPFVTGPNTVTSLSGTTAKADMVLVR